MFRCIDNRTMSLTATVCLPTSMFMFFPCTRGGSQVFVSTPEASQASDAASSSTALTSASCTVPSLLSVLACSSVTEPPVLVGVCSPTDAAPTVLSLWRSFAWAAGGTASASAVLACF